MGSMKASYATRERAFFNEAGAMGLYLLRHPGGITQNYRKAIRN
jgi:hypothetical protein